MGGRIKFEKVQYRRLNARQKGPVAAELAAESRRR